MIRVTSVEPLEGLRALLAFTDGTVREVELRPYLHGPVFAPVRDDPAFFRLVRVEYGTLAWPNGADIDPDVLYHDLRPAWHDDQTSMSRQG